MKNIIWLKLFVFAFFIFIFSSPSYAFYKKKVLVGQFQNPANWVEPYHPGNVISELLTQELMRHKGVQLISISEHMMRLMEKPVPSSNESSAEPAIFDFERKGFPGILLIQDSGLPMEKPAQKINQMNNMIDRDPLWPTKLGRKPTKSTFTEIIGTVIKFQPDTKREHFTGSDSLEHGKRENAEVQVHVEILQHNTGRVLFQKTFKAFSSNGTQPFAIENLNSKNMNEKSELSSMNFALNSLKQEIGLFISAKLDSLLLEGEVIATKRKEIAGEKGKKSKVAEEILINLGSSNGVRIGDLLQVHAVGLGLNDPYTASDLGDVYVRIGVIQILQIWEGTAKAMPLAGKNFETGFLVRSITSSRQSKSSSTNGESKEQEEEKVPWWEFHGIRSVH
jgi:hypothetical protein